MENKESMIEDVSTKFYHGKALLSEAGGRMI
jgi:hypothetical protein